MSYPFCSWEIKAYGSLAHPTRKRDKLPRPVSSTRAEILSPEPFKEIRTRDVSTSEKTDEEGKQKIRRWAVWGRAEAWSEGGWWSLCWRLGGLRLVDGGFCASYGVVK